MQMRATRPRPRGRPKAVPDAAKRRSIVNQALLIFQELGYARMTTDIVASRCRISKTTLYRLFPSKSELMAAIIETHNESMIALPGDYDHLPLSEALERIFFNDLDDEADRQRFAFLQFLILEAAVNPELKAISEKFGRRAVLRLLADWIDSQCALGRLDVPDALDAATMLIDMVGGSIALTRDGQMQWPGSARRRAYVSECIRVFIGGVARRDVPGSAREPSRTRALQREDNPSAAQVTSLSRASSSN
ncbi:TetR/AcrR family transcriptional regulator [Ancylobacter sp. IITR112]|uniref:TetR/AcrR family transcriptional regulator n=1 Tax=Ancylobacter sp. IITR112 TaxID=3138073 RepID=UPI00352A5BD4